ncbi:MAG: zinc ribbon domain-containing protein [Roseburia sp.]|nr:zinc ribbon domain-containing protein [Roseburia sp.]
MNYCTKCGNPIPENAKFCSKCGAPVSGGQSSAENVSAPSVVEEKPPKEPKKPVDFTKFNKIFWMLFVVSGVCAYLLSEAAVAYTSVSTGFTITLGVLAIIAAICFCATGIVRFISFLKESEENRAKYRLCNSLCLAIGIIVFVFVLLVCIAVFISASDYADMSDAFSSLFG